MSNYGPKFIVTFSVIGSTVCTLEQIKIDFNVNVTRYPRAP